PVLSSVLLSLGLGLAAPRAEAQFFNAVFSRDAGDVIAVGDSGAVYRSFDGGASWTSFLLGTKPLRGVAARGWTIAVVGDSGKIWRSVDDGGSWSLQVKAGTPSLRAIESLGGDSLVAVGSGGTVLRSLDGGATWSAQASGTSATLRAVRFSDAQHGGMAGAGGWRASTGGGGARWAPVAWGAEGRRGELELPAARAEGADLGPVFHRAQRLGGEQQGARGAAHHERRRQLEPAGRGGDVTHLGVQAAGVGQ